MSSDGSINLDYRPAPRLFPLSAEDYLLSRVKGSARRRALRAAIREGTLADLPAGFQDSALSDEERSAVSAIHPFLMSGEYLPDLEDDELEIARIRLMSVTGDVISVRAKKQRGLFHYRVVDEYGDECLRQPTLRRSRRPLTLREFAKFVLHASELRFVIGLNDIYGEEAQGFVGIDSSVYPDFAALVRERIGRWYPERSW